MAIDYEKLLELQIPDTQQSYTHKDTILYALSLGYASDPLDRRQLPLVYEADLQAVPTMGVVLAHPGYWPRTLNTGLDWVRIVHAEQGLTLHKPLPAEARVVGKSRVVDIIDKGADKGALITYERRILERDSGDPLCTITQTMLARGDGGFGGPQRSVAPPPAVPERAADHCVDLPTLPNMALLYRLNGDWNPCMPTRTWRTRPVSVARFCMAWPPGGSPAGPSCRRCAISTAAASPRYSADSPRLPIRARPSARKSGSTALSSRSACAPWSAT